MASFCKQASIDLFGKDYGDFKGDHETLEYICEDCGFVKHDSEGNCLGGPMCMHGAAKEGW